MLMLALLLLSLPLVVVLYLEKLEEEVAERAV